MPEGHDHTLGTPALPVGGPPVEDDADPAGASEDQQLTGLAIQRRAQQLAYGAVVAKRLHEKTACTQFVQDILALDDNRLGIIHAIHALTTLKLDGVPIGQLRPDAVIAPSITPSARLSVEERAPLLEAVDRLTELWSAKATATNDYVRYAKAVASLGTLKDTQLLMMLTVMVLDVQPRVTLWHQVETDGQTALYSPDEDLLQAGAEEHVR